jgi:hypothetical protein
MTCESFEGLIALRTSGDLADAEAATVQAHLTSCAHCRALEAELMANQNALESLAGEDVAHAAVAVRRRVLEAVDELPRRAPWPQAPSAALAAAVLIAMAILLPRAQEPATDQAVHVAAAPARPTEVESPPPTEPLATMASAPRISTPVATRRAAIAAQRRPARFALEQRLAAAPDTSASVDAEPGSTSAVLKIATRDPNIVIYWVLAPPDSTGDSAPAAASPSSPPDSNGGPS